MRSALIVTAIAGALICAVLLYMSMPSAQSEPASSRLCTPTEHVNCDYVLSSQWARIGPIPTAALGLVYFLTLTAWYCLIGIPNSAGRTWHWIPLGLNSVSLLASLIYVYLMAATLPVWCTWCLAAHVVNFILLVLAVAARPRKIPTTDSAYPSSARGLGVLGGCLAITITVVAVVIGYRMQVVARQYQMAMLKATNNPEYILWRLSQATSRELRLDEDFCIGKSDSPHSVVAFTDFECNGCAAFHRFAARLTSLFPDSVHIAFRHYPLCHECNPYCPTTKHFFACEAARAAEAARRIGTWQQAFSYQDMLFANAARLSQRPYEQMAKAAGIDTAAWKRAIDDPATNQRIARDVESANRLGVEGTPAIFLDGQRLETWHILTTEPQPVVDLEATDRLWKRLLGIPGEPSSAKSN